ncbi:MAG: hypothetical protein HQ527_00590 [Cyanobacteria bacterium]|nr:hypothetical protein [Cyanobacteria bacterium bin.51]
MDSATVASSIAKLLKARFTLLGMLTLVSTGTFSAVLAAPVIPNLIGTWTVEGKGAVLCKVEASRCKTHHHGEFSDLNAVAQITKQQGRTFHGVFKSKYATEKFVGTLGHDNATLYIVDEDGFTDGKIISPSMIQVVYRHTSELDSVVDVGTWRRR